MMHLKWLATVGETLPKDKTNHSILHLKQPLLASTPIVGAQDCKQGGDVSTEHRVQKHEFNSRKATPVIIGMPQPTSFLLTKA
jgi:hypothetical protein